MWGRADAHTPADGALKANAVSFAGKANIST